MIKAVRIFYRKSDGEIVWTHTLMGTGVFPTTKKADLLRIPSTMPDGESPLGGNAVDYACIEETNSQRVISFLNSDSNKVIDGKLIIGAKRITPEPELTRNLAAEIDEIKAMLKEK